jgi:DNA-binding GntR family transcriptional regulator
MSTDASPGAFWGTPPGGPRPLSDFQGTLSQRAYQSLREAVLGFVFRPGEPLRKGELCDLLGVSRSPVSEALARLASEGLVDVIPQAGTFVSLLSMADIREGAFLRQAIELAAVEFLAPMIGPPQVLALRRSLRVQEVLVGDGDVTGFYEQDRQMHDLILSFTGFRKLAQVAESAWANVDRARRLTLPVAGRIEATLSEHAAIVDALAANDPGAAREAMRHHLGQLTTYLAPLESEYPELFTPG